MDDFDFFSLKRNEVSTRDARRAYSRLLKQHRPDVDPAGFMELQERYQRLLDAIEDDENTGSVPDVKLFGHQETDSQNLTAEDAAGLASFSPEARAWQDKLVSMAEKGYVTELHLEQGFRLIRAGVLDFGQLFYSLMGLGDHIPSLRRAAGELAALCRVGHCNYLSQVVRALFAHGEVPALTVLGEKLLLRDEFPECDGAGELLVLLGELTFLVDPEFVRKCADAAFVILPVQLRSQSSYQLECLLPIGDELAGYLKKDDLKFWTERFGNAGEQVDWSAEENAFFVERLPLRGLYWGNRLQSLRALLGHEYLDEVHRKMSAESNSRDPLGKSFGQAFQALFYVLALLIFIMVLLAFIIGLMSAALQMMD